MGDEMINKDKVNEILADMKEEERKKQEAIEAEVAKFLEGRLEYYVAMVLDGKSKTPGCLKKVLISDGCKNYEVAMETIDSALSEYDWYRCLVYGMLEYHIFYMSIYNSSTDGEQFDHVKKRQIELGLRKEDISLEDEIDLYFTIEQPETSLIAWIALYMIIIMAIILFFIFK